MLYRLFFVFIISCSHSPKRDKDPQWIGQPIEKLENHRVFSKVYYTKKESDHGRVMRTYKKFGRHQSKAFCGSFGGCDWLPNAKDCYFYFNIANNIITEFSADRGCYTKDLSPNAP